MKNTDTMTHADVEHLIGVSWGAVKKWAERGLLPCWRMPIKSGGSPLRFRRQDVYAFMRERGIPFAGAVEANQPDILVLTRQAGFGEAIKAKLPEGVSLHTAASAVEAGVMLREFPPLVLVVDELWPESAEIAKQLLTLAKWKPVVCSVCPNTLESADPQAHAERLSRCVNRAIDRAREGASA